jgi:predicted molibdopterin-dependent oxidoreductase YjgC
MAVTRMAYVDGVRVGLEAGASLLKACDAAGRYVPRLCFHPAVGAGREVGGSRTECGLCVVHVADGSTVLACCAEVTEGAEVCTDDSELRRLRAERLAALLARHPHVCLSCPDREGCSRDQCVHGNAPEARCCDQLGHCEFGRLVAFVDPHLLIPRRAVLVPRSATVEGRIRREPGLCVACGRCVKACSTFAEAGDALEMSEVARPKTGTLRGSGCTFCGLCVLLCPTGAITAPGAVGASWLAARRKEHQLLGQVLPPDELRLRIPADVSSLPGAAGVLTLLDATGAVLRIMGVADLARGLDRALGEPAGAHTTWFRYEVEPLYTQRETELLAQYVREHGHLPAGNDLGDDLFDDAE